MNYFYNCDCGEENWKGAFEELLEILQEGDCLTMNCFADAGRGTGDFLAVLCDLTDRGVQMVSMAEGFDSATESGSFATHILRNVLALDQTIRLQRQQEGIRVAKEEGRYRGRKPIAVDDSIFDRIVARWNSGEITARQAMQELNLKPNTFYRRVKERMNDMKNGEAIISAAKELRKEIRTGVQAEREELHETAGRIVNEYKEGTLKDAVKQRLEADAALAETVISMRRENLERDIRDAKAQLELKQQVRREAEQYKSEQ